MKLRGRLGLSEASGIFSLGNWGDLGDYPRKTGAWKILALPGWELGAPNPREKPALPPE